MRPSVRRILVHFTWSFAIRQILRSRRLDPMTTVGTVFTLGVAMAPVVLGSELLWVVTGRGRRLRRLIGGDVIVVLPGNTKRAIEEAVERARREAGAEGEPA
jgi:ABC-type molybdate transport system permease subunit